MRGFDEKELKVMRHALGIDPWKTPEMQDGAYVSHRNHYCASNRIEKSNKNQFFFLASTCHCFSGLFRRSSTVGQSASVNSVVRLPT